MARLVSGSRVHHRVMGPGVIRGVLDGGRTVLVAFDIRPRAPYLYPAADLVPLDAGPPPPPRPRANAAPPAPPPRPEPSWAPVDRQSLEALRLGVVPVLGLERLTVGREEERARVGELLDAGRGMLVLSGGYGTGKTHMLELAEAEALRRGFLVGRATFDPVEVPPSHPLRLYRAVIEGLRYPGGAARGLRPLFEELGDSERHLSPTGERFHRWLSPAAWAARHVAEPLLADAYLDWVEGHSEEDAHDLTELLRRRGWAGPRLLGLPDYRTFGQLMAHLLGGIATWARDAGHKGLVVLLDEAEYLDGLGAVSRDMAENVLKYLAIGTLPREALAFDPDAVYRGGHAVHRAVPPVFDENQPLAVLCAFTPHPLVDAALRRLTMRGGVRLPLDPIPARLFPLLADRVLAMVQELHPEVQPEPQFRHLLRQALARAFEAGEIETSRQAARLCVEYWDLYRDAPDRAVRALRA